MDRCLSGPVLLSAIINHFGCVPEHGIGGVVNDKTRVWTAEMAASVGQRKNAALRRLMASECRVNKHLIKQ